MKNSIILEFAFLLSKMSTNQFAFGFFHFKLQFLLFSNPLTMPHAVIIVSFDPSCCFVH